MKNIGGPSKSPHSAQFRHLRPGLGRWAKRDPAGDVDGPNLYRYGPNNPLSGFDPLGLDWQWSEVKAILQRSAVGREALRMGYGEFVEPRKTTFRASGEGGTPPVGETKYLASVGDPFPIKLGNPIHPRAIQINLSKDIEKWEAAATYVHEAVHVSQLEAAIKNVAVKADFTPEDDRNDERAAYGVGVTFVNSYSRANKRRMGLAYKHWLNSRGIRGGISINETVNDLYGNVQGFSLSCDGTVKWPVKIVGKGGLSAGYLPPSGN